MIHEVVYLKKLSFSMEEIRSMPPPFYDELVEPLYDTPEARNDLKMSEAVKRLKSKFPDRSGFDFSEVLQEMNNG